MSQIKLKFLEEIAEQIPSLVLPTNRAVLKAIYFEKDRKNLNINDAIKLVSVQIHEIWQRAMIPTISQRRIQQRISDYCDKYVGLLKINKTSSKIDLFKVCFK